MGKLVVALATALVAVVAVVPSAHAKKKSKKAAKAEPTFIHTGDPLPKKPVTNAACADKGALRVLGEQPSTPFAMVKNGEVHEAGVACCAQWARSGSKWKTVDAYGALVGEAEVTGGEGYDVSQCYELELTKKKGAAGVGLYLQGDYVAPKSAEWTPKPSEKSALATLIAGLETAIVPESSWKEGCQTPRPFPERVLYFRMPNSNDSATDGWAVVGGPVLVLARLQSNGKWAARHVDGYGSDKCLQRAYQPRAVLDLNADGKPEVVIHYDYGDAYGDAMLGFEHVGFEGRWVDVAVAVAGSTA